MSEANSNMSGFAKQYIPTSANSPDNRNKCTNFPLFAYLPPQFSGHPFFGCLLVEFFPGRVPRPAVASVASGVSRCPSPSGWRSTRRRALARWGASAGERQARSNVTTSWPLRLGVGEGFGGWWVWWVWGTRGLSRGDQIGPNQGTLLRLCSRVGHFPTSLLVTKLLRQLLRGQAEVVGHPHRNPGTPRLTGRLSKGRASIARAGLGGNPPRQVSTF